MRVDVGEYLMNINTDDCYEVIHYEVVGYYYKKYDLRNLMNDKLLLGIIMDTQYIKISKTEANIIIRKRRILDILGE